MRANARLTFDYVMLVLLASCLAACGLVEDSSGTIQRLSSLVPDGLRLRNKMLDPSLNDVGACQSHDDHAQGMMTIPKAW